MKLFALLTGSITHCYNCGKNNRVIIKKNGKERRCFFMPRGLKVLFEGDNNILYIEKPLKFKNVFIDFENENGFMSVGCSNYPIRDAKFYIEENSRIIIGQNCQLKSRNLTMTANGSYEEPAVIKLGNGVFVGPNAIIRTSDGHTMIDSETGEPLNPTENVEIEDNVWITSNCIILKGSHISKGSIVGAGSIVNKKFEEENILIAGVPAKIIKRSVTWDKSGFGTYSRKYYEEKV